MVPLRNPARTIALSVVSLALPALLSAQGGGGGGGGGGGFNRPPRNLQVLPKTLTGGEVRDRMRVISTSLDVDCEYCHVQTTGPDGRSQTDHASDDKEMKKIAREMMRLVNDINDKYLIAGMGKTLGDRERVSCETCHRGLAKPRTIQSELLAAIDARGGDSAVALYRSLRSKYYARGSYDFSELPLTEMGRLTTQRQAVIALLKLNLEFYPQSARSFLGLAQQSLQLGDTAAAIDALTKASELEPNNQQLRGQLTRLRGTRPPF